MNVTAGSRLRETWLDVAKGIGILLVVLGHSYPTPLPESIWLYIYWVHLPLFFAASGYLFSPITSWQAYRGFVKKRAVQLLVPYVAGLALVTLIQVVLGGWHFVRLDVLVMGGRFLSGENAPLWFLTCMFATQLLFAAILLLFRRWYWCLLAILGCFALAQWQTHVPGGRQLLIPWSVDVALIAVVYFAFGYIARPVVNLSCRYARVLMAVAGVAAVALIVASRLGHLPYYFEMMQMHYTHPLLDLLVPPVMVVAVFGLCHLLAATRLAGALAYLGAASLVIMYLHWPAYHIVTAATGRYYGVLGFTVIGVLVPLLAKKGIFDRFASTRLLFLGCPPRRERTG